MERIHVSVRARPLSPEEAKSSSWRISGNCIFIPNNNSSNFEFDRIFGDNCPTLEVYHTRTKDIVAAAVRGFNGTVFAYGQTNSGKTHTMRGSPNERGVIPLSVYDLFDTVHKEVDREFLLRMSYMEIYNEEINDLLAPEHRKLQIHENLERGIYVAGLKEEIVATPEQVLEFMEFGESHRHIGETNMNTYSSRSHTIFRMIIESRAKSEDEVAGSACDAVRVSVLNLVDLAGSERAAKTGAEGVRLKEGSHINKSLMTLGTVIKKLSEGAESHGGHVPYRDSKLTRILQPALGGNSNTAIICNITLAQIHADETKSSLQFASRALRITNCARVNEVLTDAALLKRQKKEIEELRAKLQGSHSEHLGEEILNLRNILLQTELERERIALELEEEKKIQAERERRLQEQAKKIENLSSIVLYSTREEYQDNIKKDKRRVTWCPGKLPQEIVSKVQVRTSSIETERCKREMEPLLSFDKLVEEDELGMGSSCKTEKDLGCNKTKALKLPDPPALLHVTSRRKTSARSKTLSEENTDTREIQAEYENLLVKFETQRIASELKINFLETKLAEVGSSACTQQKDSIISPRESEALLVIKQLEEQIKVLELEKSSTKQNLDSLVALTTEQNISTRKKIEELQDELLNAKEAAQIACERHASTEPSVTDEGDIDSMNELSIDIEGIAMEIQSLKNFVDSIFCLVDDAFRSLSSISGNFLDLKKFADRTILQQNSIITNHEKLQHCMEQKIYALEDEKLLLLKCSAELQKQIEDMKCDSDNSEMSLMVLKEQHESESFGYLKQIQDLQKEISRSSSSMLAKEHENLRKDLDKTKVKLKETQSKLRNVIQEKTKLEGEKASAEREIKRLQGQKVLERDINKRESIAGRRRDSSMVDTKRLKGQQMADHLMQEDYKNLEVLAFEMEATIVSLEEDLAAAHMEKEELISKTGSLTLELESQTENVTCLTLELNKLQEEVTELILKLEESRSCQEAAEASLTKLVEEKEELAMQLSESLLEIEEEKAVWASKEKHSIEAIEEKAKLYNIEVTSLSREMLEVKNDLESYKGTCRALEEKLQSAEEDAEQEKRCRLQKDSEIELLKNELGLAQSNIEVLSLEHQNACEKMDKLQKELNSVAKEKEDLLIQLKELEHAGVATNLESLNGQLVDMAFERDRLKVLSEEQKARIVEIEHVKRSYADKLSVAEAQADELAQRILSMEVEKRKDEQNTGKERAKLRMRLKWTQAKLDAVRNRYTEVLAEQKLMDTKFKEASGKLKERLVQSGIEVLNLKKQVASTKSCAHCQA